MIGKMKPEGYEDLNCEVMTIRKSDHQPRQQGSAVMITGFTSDLRPEVILILND